MYKIKSRLKDLFALGVGIICTLEIPHSLITQMHRHECCQNVMNQILYCADESNTCLMNKIGTQKHRIESDT